MSEAVNMVQEVKELASRPRGRACVVLTHDFLGQKKWAAELARQTENEHIDLLDHFIAKPKLAMQCGQFSVPRLFDYLKGISTAPVLIISGLEFIKATWAGRSKSSEQFAVQVEMWNSSPCLLFVMQFDNIIANTDFKRYSQYKFVIDQKETLAL
jgi:hypothetical protein